MRQLNIYRGSFNNGKQNKIFKLLKIRLYKSIMYRVILCSLLSIISLSLRSQFFDLGLKGGIGFSHPDNFQNGKLVHQPNSYYLASFNGGIILNLKLNECWYFHSEIIFEDKGNKISNHHDTLSALNIDNATSKNQIHNYFIQFPQTVRFLIPLSKTFKINMYVEAGGYFAYYLTTHMVSRLFYNGKMDKTVTDLDWVNAVSDNLQTTHRFNWGATGGIGLLLPTWKGNWDLNFKYDYLLQPFITTSNPNKDKLYWEVIGITIGYSLPVSKKSYH